MYQLFYKLLCLIALLIANANGHVDYQPQQIHIAIGGRNNCQYSLNTTIKI